jgi:HKD family nuclease
MKTKEITRIELIENKGPNNMRDELRKSFHRSSKVDIAVAFMNLNGLNLILGDIMKFLGKSNSRMRVLTRISNDAFNEPAALRNLLDLCEEFEKKCEVRTARLVSNFHQKMYIFANSKSATVFVGSSNLTGKALEREGEVNVKITALRLNDVFKQAAENFDEYWNDADELSYKRLDAYASYCTYVHSIGSDKKCKRLWKKVSDAMRKREAKRASVALEKKMWLDCVDGFLEAETEKTLKEYTNWNRLQYYSCGLDAYEKFNRNDVLVLADYNNKHLNANHVKSKTKTSRTPDGRYFVAYQKICSSRYKKITRGLISRMKRAGTIERASDLKPTSARILSGSKLEQFSRMLNFRVE